MITISGMTRQFGLASSFAKKYGATITPGSSKSKGASELATAMASLGQRLEEARASKSSGASAAAAASASTGSAGTANAVSEHESAMSDAIAQIKQNLESRLASSGNSPTYSRPTVKASASSSSGASSADSLLSAVQKKGERDLMNAKVLSTVHASGIGAIKGSYTVTVDPSSSKVSVEASGEGSSSEQAKAIEDALNDAGMSSALYSHIRVSAQGQGNSQLEDASDDDSTALSISLSSDGLHDLGQENGYGNGDTAWIQKLQAGL